MSGANGHTPVIVGATRTAIGTFGGALAEVAATTLGSEVIKEALRRAKVDPAQVDEVIMGNILSAGLGQGPARQSAINAGLPVEVPATTINKLCGSGLKAVSLAAQAILLGDADIVVAGGMENMSRAPYLLEKARYGYRLGDGAIVDSMMKDGLVDAFYGYPMGITAENVAERYQISRAAQDEFAVGSQNKASSARASGRFKDEIAAVTVKGRKGDTIIDTDEYIRDGATIEAMAALRPAFKKDGSVTAANASGLNDGAVALVLMSAAEAAKRGATVLGRIASWASVGVDPAVMGIGPVPASRKALEKAGWSVADLDLIEANEAFAAQALAVGQELGLDPAKVNVNGGAIAIGHPIGASGARVLTTLLYEMAKRDAHKGLATLCIGGGMGIAMCIER